LSSSDLIGIDELKAKTKINSISGLELWLNQNNIRFMRCGTKGKPAILTTVGMIESALGLRQNDETQANDII